MTLPNDLSSPLNDAEYLQLNRFLHGLDFDGAILNISELDGFFTAVVSGPEMIVPSKWLEVIWGDKANSPVWDNQEEFQRVFGLLMRHMNSTADTLMDNPMAFEPCFMQRTVEGVNYTIVDEWCSGYMKGVALCPDSWAGMPGAEADLMAPMLMFTTESGLKQLDGMEQQEIEFWQGQIEPAARRIHAYWLAQRSAGSAPQFHPSMFPAAANDEPFVRATPKVGRNDPCPCGSGKKYKKCCGLH